MKIYKLIILKKHFFFLSIMLLAFITILGTACSVGPAPEPEECPDSVSIKSNNDDPWIANVGHVVTVSVSKKIKTQFQIVEAKIGGKEARINKKIGCYWEITRTMMDEDPEGPVGFSIEVEPVPFEPGPIIIDDNESVVDETVKLKSGSVEKIDVVTDESYVILDKTPPIITGEITTPQSALTGFGWYLTDVTVNFYATDNLSGIKQIEVPSTDLPGIDFSSTDVGDNWMNVDVTLSADVMNQSIIGTAIDRAGNKSEPFEIPGLSINRIVVLVVDGAKNAWTIAKSVVEAADYEDIQLLAGINYQLAECTVAPAGYQPLDGYLTIVNNMVENQGLDAENPEDKVKLRLLIIGKSLGGANMYKFVQEYADELNDFEKVALVLVDSHEPTNPGDEGTAGECFSDSNDDKIDFVCFTDECGYCLKWLDTYANKFNSVLKQGAGDAKLRVYNIYQRHKFPRGYHFADAYENLNTLMWEPPGSEYCYTYKDGSEDCYVNGEVYHLESQELEVVEHFNIPFSRETRNLIQDAIEYLKE